MSGSNRKLQLYALIAIAAFLTCNIGTVRSQTTTPAGGAGTVSPANKRYLVYGAPWAYQAFTTFALAVDEAVNDGFNAVRLHVPWMDTQLPNGAYDFSKLDQEVAYVANTKHLPVALLLDLTRPSSGDPVSIPADPAVAGAGFCGQTRPSSGGGGDTVLSPADVMQDAAGRYCGRMEWNAATKSKLFVNQLSFASDSFVQKANAFIQTVVYRYYTRYPGSILYVTTGVGLMTEVAYQPIAVLDYSPGATSRFRQWIQARYASIDSLNWRAGIRELTFPTSTL
jgi:hypothetical protein